ncbi:MAG: glycerol kinase GlpK [Anaerolineae bacterium]
MGRCIAAVDQGTTGTRCIIYDETGAAIASAYREHTQVYPRPGWIEHDPLEIWANTQQVMAAALHSAQLHTDDLAALGIANQRETVVVWNRKTGQPYTNAVVWQCTRSREMCQHLLEAGLEPEIHQRTGLVIATYFSASKIAWLLDNIPGLRAAAEQGDALVGTIDSWLTWNLTGGPQDGIHVTDVTNASRTMLMNLRTLQWDDDLCGIFDIPQAMLPAIQPSCGQPGCAKTSDDCALGGGIPLAALLGDQQAALVGQTCFAVGEAKNTYGTGSFMLMNIGAKPVLSQHGLLTTVAYGLEPGQCTFALEGSIAVTGAAVQWLRDNLGLIAQASDTEEIAASVPDCGGVYFVPAFAGMYAPHWDMDARGLIIGLTRHSSRAHLVRATLEAICYQSREVLEAMERDANVALTSLRVDGGAVGNNLLLQLQADILDKTVIRPAVRETTALGAAYMAGLAVGFWPDLATLRQLWRADCSFTSQWDDTRRSEGYRLWQRAVSRARGWLTESSLETAHA